jgi:hypothetical protein
LKATTGSKHAELLATALPIVADHNRAGSELHLADPSGPINRWVTAAPTASGTRKRRPLGPVTQRQINNLRLDRFHVPVQYSLLTLFHVS